MEDKDNLVQIHLAEFKALRGEIARRSSFQTAVLTIQLAAIGSILAVALQQCRPEILLALPFISSFALLSYATGHAQICTLGYYIGENPRPKLFSLTGHKQPVLEWEAPDRPVPRVHLQRIAERIAEPLPGVVGGPMGVFGSLTALWVTKPGGILLSSSAVL